MGKNRTVAGVDASAPRSKNKRNRRAMSAGAYSPPLNSIGISAQTTIRLAARPANNPNRRNERHISHAKPTPANANTNHAITYDIDLYPSHYLPCKIIRVDIFLGDDVAIHTDPCTSNFVSIPSNERMPLVQWKTLIQQPVCTSIGQPGKITNRIRIEAHAILNELMPLWIMTTTATLYFK